MGALGQRCAGTLGLLDPHLLMLGLERGMQTKRDMMDGWDHWADFERPVDEIRESFGIEGTEDLWFTPPVTDPSDNRAAID